MTRSCNYMLKFRCEFIDNSIYVIRDLKQRDLPSEKIQKIIIQFLITYYAYYMHQFYENNDINRYISDVAPFISYIKNIIKIDEELFYTDYFNELFYSNHLIKLMIINKKYFPKSFWDFYKLFI